MRAFVKLLALASVLAVLFFAVYPAASDQLSRIRAERVIESYRQQAAEIPPEQRASLLGQAKDVRAPGVLPDPFDEGAALSAPADPLVTFSGVMGALEVPRLGIALPIYRQAYWRANVNGAGHVTGTTLPVGAEGGNAALCGYGRRLSASLFAGLERLLPGDRFTVEVLGERRTYEVEKVWRAARGEAMELETRADADLCTLVTERGGELVLAQGHRTTERPGIGTDGVTEAPFWRTWPAFGLPVLAAGLAALIVVEWLIRGLQRWRIRRLKL